MDWIRLLLTLLSKASPPHEDLRFRFIMSSYLPLHCVQCVPTVFDCDDRDADGQVTLSAMELFFRTTAWVRITTWLRGLKLTCA